MNEEIIGLQISIDDEWFQAEGSIAIFGAKGGGKGGGGGSSRAAQEADNNLRASAIVKVVEVVAEGQIEGICGGAQGIYINDTPLQNSDGSWNFTSVQWDYRVGLPSQDYMPGFSSVESETSVASPVTIAANNIVRTVSDIAIDAARVTIQLPNGLYDQNTTNGDINGSSLNFRIDYKLTSSGTWTTGGTYTISGKTTSPYEVQYLINRPAGTGLWDIRVVRLTADSNRASLKNDMRWERKTDLQYIKLAYNDTAVVGIAVDAASVGNSIPSRAYLIKGLRIQVPSNYNPVTRVYTGGWNGTFITAWTDNPAWCLYDTLVNSRYGMGQWISASDIEKYSFYDAGVYSDELVNDGKGGTEPRFAFNARIAAQEPYWKIAQMIAGCMRANLLYINDKFMVVQDRPMSPVKTITNENVKDGKFIRKGSARSERHTAFNVTWNNRADRHLQVVSTVEDTAGIARYGYYPIDIAAFGATTEGQAIRAGRWAMYTELNQVHQLTFEMTFDGFDLLPGDVIKVMDKDWANVTQGGRVTSAVTSTTVNLSTPVTLSAGSTISVNMPDGSGIQSRNITQTSGTLSTITIGSAFSMTLPVDTVYVIETVIAAKQFKIINIKQTDVNSISLECVEHDPNKYAWVETGVLAPSPIFSNAVNVVVKPPTNLVFKEESYIDAAGLSQRQVRASWTPPSQTIKGYRVYHVMNGSNANSTFVDTPSILIDAKVDGLVELSIYSVGFNGNESGMPLTGNYYVDSTKSAGSILGTFNAVQSFWVTGTTSLTWNQDDLSVSWIDNVANTTPTNGYKVQVLDVNNTLLREVIVDKPLYIYSLTDNYNDAISHATTNGQPARASVQIKVWPRDASLRFGPAATKTFTNPPPAAPTSVVATGSFMAATVTYVPPADLDVRGALIWRGTTVGFTPSSANLVYEGTSNQFSETGLANSTTYYYKIALYDAFSRDLAGAGLNVATSGAVLTLDANNTNEYRISGATWTPNSPSANSVAWSACTAIKSVGTSAGTTWSVTAGNAAWSSGVLYIYYTEGETIFRSTTSVTNAVAPNKIIVATYRGGTNLEIGDGRAYMDGGFIIAGTVAAAQLVTGSAVITTSAQIANATLTNAMLVDATIDTLKLKNGSVISFSAVSNGSTASIGPVSANGQTSGVTLGSGSVTPATNIYVPSPIGIAGPFSGVVSIYMDATRSTTTAIAIQVSTNLYVYTSGGALRYSYPLSNVTSVSGTQKTTICLTTAVTCYPGDRISVGDVTIGGVSVVVISGSYSMQFSVGPFLTISQINLR